MKERVAAISILANGILAGGKITIGFFSHSAAVFAEGIHSLMDIFSSIISYAGIKIAQKPADKRHPYGHYKYEVLAGVIITLILLFTGLGIIYEAFQKLFIPEPIKIGYLPLGIMLFSAIVNEIMARIKIYVGQKENSISLLSDGFHSRVDVLASLIVLVGLILAKYWTEMDAILAIFIGIYIVRESLSLGKEAVDSLLDVSAGEDVEQRIKSIVENEGIILSSLKTQKKGTVITANLEIKLPNNLTVEEATKISENLREKLMNEIENLSYVAIQIQSHKVETGFYKPAWGRGFGWRRRYGYREGEKEVQGKGPGGFCVCPKCGYKVPHQRGVPCSNLYCSKCKIPLKRE